MQEIVVDVRDLPSPEPLEKVLAALPEIGEGRYVKMVHRMEPGLLFPILKRNDFDYRQRFGNDREVLIYIFLKNDRTTYEYVMGL